MAKSPRGQKLIKIEGKDHYYYDAASLIIYYIRKTKGELIKFSTLVRYNLEKESEQKSALIKAARFVSKKEKSKKEKKKKLVLNKLMGQHIDDMVKRVENEGKTKGTVGSYKNSAKHLKEFFGDFLPHECEDDNAWLSFVNYFQEKHPGWSLFNLTKHYRALTIYLHRNGIMKRRPLVFNPNKKKEAANRRKKRHRAYKPDEILKMDAVCNDDQRLSLWLGYDMGFRQSDCTALTWDRIFLEGKNPYIQFFGDENKTGFSGRVPLSDTCCKLLKARKLTVGNSPWVFALKTDTTRPMKPQQIEFEKVVRASGVNYGSHQILRHTRLTEDFGNPDLADTLVMKIRRVSLKVALEHYIHPTEADYHRFRNTGLAKLGVS